MRRLIIPFVFFIVLIGLIAALFGLQHSTNNQQHASKFEDINSADEITSTINPDGTMGPATAQGNYSNSFPGYYLGTLAFQVTDPANGHRPTDIPTTAALPTQVSPTHTFPTHVQGNENAQNNNPSITPTQHNDGPQAVSSLVLSVWKVEVHLAHVALPGQKDDENDSSSQDTNHPFITDKPSVTNKPSMTPKPSSTNQGVDKWETLQLTLNSATKTVDVDLVALAKSHNFSKLGLTKLVGGRYTEIRLYIKSAGATLTDGTKVTPVIPGKANIVRIVRPFVIVSGKTTTLSIDFDAQNSIIKTGSDYLLKPVVAHIEEQ